MQMFFLCSGMLVTSLKEDQQPGNKLQRNLINSVAIELTLVSVKRKCHLDFLPTTEEKELADSSVAPLHC